MTKTAIIYQSLTGHSKKIAVAIGKAVGAPAQNIKRKPVVTETNLLIIVGGIYSGKSLPKMLEYVKTLSQTQVDKVVLITSSASNKSGQDEIKTILTAKGINVLAEYRCFGSFLFIKMGHPNKKEILNSIDFINEIIKNNK